MYAILRYSSALCERRLQVASAEMQIIKFRRFVKCNLFVMYV
jgi:hypothetical protein